MNAEREPKRVTCALHGPGFATFVCQHLRSGVACGFHALPPEPGNEWPDAWCDACELVRARAGGWEQVADAVERISTVCHTCYAKAHDRNCTVPPGLTTKRRPLARAAYRRFVERAVEETREKQARADERFQLGAHQRWAADYEAGRFSMTSDGRAEVVADLELVGSLVVPKRSWLWSWANPSNQPHLYAEVARLSTLGEVRGIRALAEPHLDDADEVDGWELTAVACSILGAEACYRAPMDDRLLFMLLRNLRWTS